MRIYLICSVRQASSEAAIAALAYVKLRETVFHDSVFYPPRDAKQDDPTGLGIVETELAVIAACDEVHIIWDINSKGSHFDLGAAMALRKPMVMVQSVTPDLSGKSYEKVINLTIEKQNSSLT